MGEKIEININAVKRLQPIIKRPIQSADSVENSLVSIRNSIDWEIKQRSNVDEQLKTAGGHIIDAVNRLHRIDRFVMGSIGQYEDLERYLAAKANEIDTGYNTLFWEDGAKLLRGITVALAGALGNPGSWLRRKGIQFFLESKNGKTYIKVGKWSLNVKEFFHKPLDPARWQEIKQKLRNTLGTGKHTFNNADIQRLMAEGLPLYNNQTRDYYNKNFSKFSRDVFPEMVENLENYLGQGRVDRFNKAFVDNINPFDDFRGWLSKDVSNLGKVAKLPGILGMGIDVWDNRNTIRNADGKVDFFGSSSEQQRKFVVDTSVDVMSGSVAMAAGAAAGTLIAPPIGTVVGAGIGVTFYAATNLKVFGEHPNKKSVVDVTKDVANNVADQMADGFRKLDKIFW
jgi:hypothetical protein